MNFIKTNINGVFITEPKVFEDAGGYIDWKIPAEKVITSEKKIVWLTN